MTELLTASSATQTTTNNTAATTGKHRIPIGIAHACQETKTISKWTPLLALPVLHEVWNNVPAKQNTRDNVSINVTICKAADIIRQQSPLAAYSDTRTQMATDDGDDDDDEHHPHDC